jgi:hypothetical protein
MAFMYFVSGMDTMNAKLMTEDIILHTIRNVFPFTLWNMSIYHAVKCFKWNLLIIVLCSLVDWYQHFTETFLPLPVSRTGVVRSFETLVSMYRTMHIPEDCYLNFHCSENLSFNIRISLAYVMHTLIYNKPLTWNLNWTSCKIWTGADKIVFSLL